MRDLEGAGDDVLDLQLLRQRLRAVVRRARHDRDDVAPRAVMLHRDTPALAHVGRDVLHEALGAFTFELALLRALELLERLVAFDTTSHKSNLALIAFVEDYLAHCKVPCRRVLSADGEKASTTVRAMEEDDPKPKNREIGLSPPVE